ncbi:MAG: SpoIIE family protein phosphatase [Gammaproteobacteria bacterium SHHR-1]
MTASSKPLILSVDDVAENIHVIKGILSDDYRVSAAINGPLALKIAHKQQPDLILLDVMMPEMDGHEVCRQLKANPVTAHIPVIFVTAMTEEKNEVAALELGAVDYVTKPISPPVLRSRVSAQIRLARLRRELDEKNRLLQAERDFLEQLVGQMQEEDRFDASQLSYLHRPLERTGGDLILSARRPDGGRHLMVTDFTGHGLQAAIGGSLVAYMFYSMTARGCPAEELLCEINRVLQQKLPINVFMAAALAEIPPEGGRLRLWNAAMPDCLLQRADGQWTPLGSNLLALGIVESLDPDGAQEQPFNPGDCCYLFSDGITEAENPMGEAFGAERLRQWLQTQGPGQDLAQALERQLSEFSAERGQLDDLTLVRLRAE